MANTILEVIDLKKHFTARRSFFSALAEKEKTIPAVDGVSFYLKENETVGLVGESGCGKTTIGKVILDLVPATSGEIFFKNQNVIIGSIEKKALSKEVKHQKSDAMSMHQLGHPALLGV